MPVSPGPLIPLAASLLIAGCATATPPQAAHEPAPPPPRILEEEGDTRRQEGGSCDAAQVQERVGQPYSEALAEAMRDASGAETLRVMRPGHAYTQEYREERLSVRVDEAGIITAIDCG